VVLTQAPCCFRFARLKSGEIGTTSVRFGQIPKHRRVGTANILHTLRPSTSSPTLAEQTVAVGNY